MSIQKTITPINNTVYLERELASDIQINSVIEKGSTGFKIWKKTSIDDRISIVNKFIDNLIDLKDEISKEICWQIGRPISQCAGELRGFEERSRHMVNIAKESLQNLPATQNDEFDNFIYKSPLGIIFVMAPWNYPIITATNTIVPALISGNSLILKHSSQTPRCAELIFNAFENTGIPEGVFQFIHTDHKACEKIISDTRVAHVVFTGSVRGGQEVKKYIGTRFINAGLELGGKPIDDYAPDFWLISNADGGDPVGFITSPWYHPEKKTNIAMGYVPFDGTLNANGFPKGKVGKKFKVHLPDKYSKTPGKPVDAVIVDIPFKESYNANTREVVSS